MTKRKRTTAVLCGLFLCASVAAGCITTRRPVPADEFPYGITISENYWIGEGNERHAEFNIGTVRKGDIIYEGHGYRLTAGNTYDESVEIKQDGGLVEANADGSLNTSRATEDSYTVRRGCTTVLRSYSLNTGVILEIRTG